MEPKYCPAASFNATIVWNIFQQQYIQNRNTLVIIALITVVKTDFLNIS